jgi:caa(3)-type oxidase subunit IV
MSAPEAERQPSARALLAAWIGIVLLGALSLGLRFAHLGGLGFAVALGIAIVQAGLLALFFMDLWYEVATVRLAFGASLALLAILLALVAADVLTRSDPPLDNPPGTAWRIRG